MRLVSLMLGAALLPLALPVAVSASSFKPAPLPPAYVPDLEPPNPVAGECYARVEIPARYESTTESVLTREAHSRLSVQQPRLEARTESVLVKEASVRFEVRQPTYGTVSEQVMTRPAYDRLSVSEPSFRTVTETVQRGQSRLVWKRGNPAKLRAQGYVIHSTADAGQGGRGYSSTTQYGQSGGQRCLNDCVIWCLVEEPADSVTVTRQVMTRPAQVLRMPVPPRYETLIKQVVTDPGGVREVPVPAEYRNIQVETLVDPGGATKVDVPAEYGQVNGRRLVSDSRYEWRRVVCQPASQQRYQHRSSVQSRTTVQHGQTVYSPVATQRTYTPSHSGLAGGAHAPVLPIRRSGISPHPTYSGPAYAVPPTGATHPNAVHPGEAQRRR